MDDGTWGKKLYKFPQNKILYRIFIYLIARFLTTKFFSKIYFLSAENL